MAYEATAELARRQAELARKRAQSTYDSTIGNLATEYRQLNRDLEGGLEGRGILRSGEANRARTRLGATEKAAQLAAETNRQAALDQADLTLMQELANLQAKGYTGGTSTTGGGSGGGAPDMSIQPIDVPPGEKQKETETPAQQRPAMPSNAPAGYFYQWDEASNSWKLTAREAVTPVGMGTGQNPNTWKPGQYVSGADRKLPNGGAVVNGYYIPPGTNFAGGPQPLRPIRGAY